MYSYISGKIVGKTASGIVVENNGIGYDIGVSGNTLYDVDLGEIVKIYTYLYVREDEMSLYGFSREEEKKLFLRLIDISGIGPKMAMQILGGYDLKTLTVAIASGDVKTLCKIKGLGKKTAELIVLNLREVAAEDISGADDGVGIAGDDIADAVNALESLGIAKTDAVRAVSEAQKSVSGVENIIAYCLKQLL
ncbi:MAG: Holliday junction branch migration protein RuvA [Bacteroides sp.]|nr:Holliday junction branch migration protein RuvA [Bacillota bacterium]MCM1393777.1 Holliday junction branch migration protein RuvA [[Eubacterium] siraeum]MCM1455589.1 Holliday junction branch migration protein RuvA [Bacteroides sp.]